MNLWTKWAFASLGIALGLAVAMTGAWCAGVSAPWAAAYASSLAVSVALAAVVLQRTGTVRSMEVERGVEILGAVTLFEGPFDRLSKACLMEDGFPQDRHAAAERIDDYKLKWEQSVSTASLIAKIHLGPKSSAAVNVVTVTGTEVRDRMADVVELLKNHDPSGGGLDNAVGYGSLVSAVLAARKRHIEAVESAAKTLRKLKG